MSEAKRRQTQGSSAVASVTAAPLNGEAHIYRRSTAGLAPRSLSSQGTQPQARLPWDVAGHVLRILLAGVTRPRLSLSPACHTRPGHSAEGVDAPSRPSAGCQPARRRRTRPRTLGLPPTPPPAGIALARAAWDCLPGRVRQRRGSKVYVTEIATDCNFTSLKERRNIFAADASAVTFHGLSFMRNRCRRHRSFLRKSASPAVIF